MKSLTRVLALCVAWGGGPTAFGATTWEKQAERLQKISATMLDGVPIGEPAPDGLFAVGFQAIVSALPETNPTIGGKTEKVPSSPIHAIPTLAVSFRPFAPLAIGAWGGALMPGTEKLIGLKAELAQTAAGARVEFRINTGTGFLYIPMLYQNSSATLKGPIASATGHDTFTSQATVWAVTPGYVGQWLWWNVLVGGKSTTSKFDIEEDKTSLAFTDTLADSMPSFMLGANAGVRFGKFVLGGGQLLVPDRLFMPRVFVAYREEL